MRCSNDFRLFRSCNCIFRDFWCDIFITFMMRNYQKLQTLLKNLPLKFRKCPVSRKLDFADFQILTFRDSAFSGNRSFQAIVWGFFCNNHIVDMRFSQTCRCNPYEFYFCLKLGNVFATCVSHTGTQTSN